MGMFLLCTFLMIILYPLGIDLYLVAVPRIAQTLQGSEAQIHTAFSIYLLGMAATVLPGGMLADRHGRRPVVLGGALIFALASLVAANATGIGQFYLGRFWQGVGAGALYIMTFTVLRDVLSQARLAMALSLINGVICVIPVLAPVLGYLILSHFDWRGIFVAMALVAACSGLINLLLLKETRPPCQPRGATRPFALLRSPRFMLHSLLTSASVTAILVYVSVSPLILMQAFGFTTEQYAMVMMVMAGVSMSASFLTPLLLRWQGKQRVLALSHLAYLLAACLLLGNGQLGGHVSLLLPGFALVCVGFSCGFGVAMGEALDVCGDQVASASALLCIMQIGLSGLFIWGMGHLGMPALWMLILALLLALLGYLVVKVLLPWRAVRRVRARG
ncbi:MdtL family multidrug efflux MFS transporter [Aeromonas caviae]|uniref:MdtL family multidrug efflux MFS transporter n=1 Tax=Aeromonas caviae TaxID=648 RepID=UPI002B467EF6|nr:MdtL family multidrug efflux MFS transporter [Aeromonas caviae]